jgi:hypothetical protein
MNEQGGRHRHLHQKNQTVSGCRHGERYCPTDAAGIECVVESRAASWMPACAWSFYDKHKFTTAAYSSQLSLFEIECSQLSDLRRMNAELLLQIVRHITQR